MPVTPQRHDGYAPIADYAVVGNKRTAALVALDGSIDWLSPAGFSEPSAFSALLDSRRGGRFELAPAIPFTARRAYRPQTNVLETTLATDRGTVRVVDAMSMPATRPLDFNEVVRVIEGTGGEVPMRWRVAPRFDYGRCTGEVGWRGETPVIAGGGLTLAVQARDAGDPEPDAAGVRGSFTAREGDVAVLALSCFSEGPLGLARKEELVRRVEATSERWQRWARGCTYDGPWRDAVVRSALALDLLVDDRSSAILAAATMALPEFVGGKRNYDYRYAWLRDANLTLEAMLRLGYREQVHASLAWMLAATRRTHPLLRPIHRLDGSPSIPDETLDLDGYRGSRPVVRGNRAREQLQLGNYGDVLDTVFRYVDDGGALDAESARRIAELADFVCEIWTRPDSGVWELPERDHFTQSKLACWLALDRARQLACDGVLPRRSLGRWRAEQRRIRSYVEDRCWSERRRAYVRAAGSDELDAGVLLPARGAYVAGRPERLSLTIDALRRELGAGGALLYRYSGMQSQEGAFVACSFWMVEALARVGRYDEAREAMDASVALANDVGLLSEEIDPETLEFRGNLPQALSHLALVNAAHVLARAPERDGAGEPASSAPATPD